MGQLVGRFSGGGSTVRKPRLGTMNLVGQPFQAAGSAGFPARRTNWGLESPQNRQAGMPALQGSGSWEASTVYKPRIGNMNQWSADISVGVIVPFTKHADKNFGAPAGDSRKVLVPFGPAHGTMSLVGQPFQAVGSAGFPARRSNWGLESPQNRPAGMPALQG